MSMAAPNPVSSFAVDEVVGLRRSRWARLIDFVRHQPLGTIGMVMVGIVTVAGIGADLIAPYDPTSNDF
ncbi:MAG: hypothetical protein JO081_12430, partial [Alphaproteobacteria bacterium]|nr:hypothetical protein [Alphaproteobacteria bacterium]